MRRLPAAARLLAHTLKEETARSVGAAIAGSSAASVEVPQRWLLLGGPLQQRLLSALPDAAGSAATGHEPVQQQQAQQQEQLSRDAKPVSAAAEPGTGDAAAAAAAAVAAAGASAGSTPGSSTGVAMIAAALQAQQAQQQQQKPKPKQQLKQQTEKQQRPRRPGVQGRAAHRAPWQQHDDYLPANMEVGGRPWWQQRSNSRRHGASKAPLPAPAAAAGRPRSRGDGAAPARGGPRRERGAEPPRDRLVPQLLHYKHTCQAVLELMQQHQDRLSVRELTVACSRMGRLFSGSGAAAQGGTPENSVEHCAELFGLAVPHFESMDPQALATALWMCARFHWLPPPEQRMAWERAVWARRSDVNLIETGNIFFSLGLLRWVPEQPLLPALLDQALAQPQSLTPWMICNIMWGCARFVSWQSFQPGHDRLVQLVELALPQLGSFTTESFCSVLFSLACLRVRPDDAALTTVLDAFEWQIKNATNRQLVTSVWAMGALQLESLVTERLWSSLQAAVAQQGDSFNFSSAPLFLFGAARMGLQPSEAVMEVLLRKSRDFLPQLRTGDVAVILWALAKLGLKAGDKLVPTEFVQELVSQFLAFNRDRRPASMRHIAATLWGCAHLKFAIRPEDLRQALAAADRQATATKSLSTNDATMLLAAFESLGSAEGLAFLKRHITGEPQPHGASGHRAAATAGQQLGELGDGGDDFGLEAELRPGMG